MRDRRGVCRVLVGRPEERDYLDDLGVYGRIILKWSFKKRNGGMEWIDLAQNSDRWLAVLNGVMNLRVP
jgi:hypothetical protein